MEFNQDYYKDTYLYRNNLNRDFFTEYKDSSLTLINSSEMTCEGYSTRDSSRYVSVINYSESVTGILDLRW